MDTASVVGTALEVYNQGWQPVRVAPGSKEAVDPGWPTKAWAPENIGDFEGYNIGLMMGDRMVDIDIDRDEAIGFAHQILPPTSMKHMRDKTVRHYWYTVDQPMPTKVVFADPVHNRPIVEWRTGSHYTVIPPSNHPSGVALEWAPPARWGEPTAVPYALLMSRVRWVAAAALISRHWPEKGSRHAAALAYCGAVAQIEDVELHYRFPRILREAAKLAGDDEADKRGKPQWQTTLKKIEAGEEVTSWGTLVTECGIPKAVVDKIEEWLTPVPDPDLDEEHPDAVYGTIRRNLEMYELLERNERPEVSYLYEPLILDHGLHWLFGRSNAGKSWVCWAIAREIIKQGDRVIIFSFEETINDILDKCQSMGWGGQNLRESLFYSSCDNVKWKDPSTRKNLIQLVQDWSPRMVVFDTANDLLNSSGWDMNDGNHINEMFSTIIKPIMGKTSVVVTDHVTKMGYEGAQTRTSLPIGSQNKFGKARLVWKVETLGTKFGIDNVSKIKMSLEKNRAAVTKTSMTYRIGGGEDGQFVFEQLASEEGIDEEGIDEIVDEIVDWLSDHAVGENRSASQRQIRAGVKRNASIIGKACQVLKEESEKGQRPVHVIRKGSFDQFYHDEYSTTLDFRETDDDEGAEAA